MIQRSATRWSSGSCTDLRLPGGHLGMDERKPSTAQPGKDWASCLPCNSNSTAWFHDSVRFVNNYPISFGQKSWCNLRWPADLQRAYCKDCSILQVCTTQHQKDQALSDRACCTTSCPGPGLDYCNALLAGLPSNTIKPLQMIQNATARLVFNEPKRAHVTPLFVSLHWLPVAARIQFKTLMLAYRTTTGSAPPTSTHYYELTSPPEAWDLLVSDASWYHHREAQNHSPEHSLSPFLAGGMIFPPPSGMLDPCQFSSNNWKLISFNSTWLLKKKKKIELSLFQNLHLSLYLSLLPLLACTYLNNAWNLVLLALPLYVCLFKINRFMYSQL